MSKKKQPTNQEIYEWMRSRGYETTRKPGSFEDLVYKMDMPKILKEYFEWVSNRDGQSNRGLSPIDREEIPDQERDPRHISKPVRGGHRGDKD